MNNNRTSFVLLAVFATLLIFTTGISLAQDAPMSVSEQSQAALGTSFTYQGHLSDGGQPADGEYDFYFELFDAATDGTSIMTTTVGDVPVAGGFFTVLLDFGSGAFDGDERWLEISVRPGVETGDYTVLANRQQVTPAPYALYAVEAGNVDWSRIGSRPLGLDDGDDDTHYSAGFGLSLDNTTFNVTTDNIQSRVSGSCEIGSSIRAINADGSAECEAHGTLPVFSINTVDSTDVVGLTPSIAIGVDGLPVISYFDQTNKDLRVAHCADISCSSSTINVVDSTESTGKFTSITIGSDGFPLISYRDVTNNYLVVAHCQDLVCSTASTTAIDTSGNTGMYTSIAIGTDGLGLVSYYEKSAGNLMAAHCDDLACTSAITTILDNGTDVGQYSSITIGADGLGLISYYDANNEDLKVAHCDDRACTSATITTLATGAFTGYDTSITTGTDGLGLISFYGNGYLRVAHCDVADCSSATLTTIDSAGANTGWKTAITIGADGLGLISYFNANSNKLKVAHCSDSICSTATNSALTDVGDVTETESASSIALGGDGFGVISFFDHGSDDLVVVHCSNSFCMPFVRRR